MDNRNLSVSVLITVHDQAQEIREKLPAYLTQNYDSGYEVIVIDETSTDETPDVLKILREEYPKLHTTFLPKSNKTTQRRKYALSIGVKASGSEYIIISNILIDIPSDDTMKLIAEAMDTDADLTLGYFTKKVKREQAYDLLNLFQQKLSFGSLLLARIRILFKNMFASTTTISL